MVSVPGTPRPGGDRGEPASSEGREELGSPRLPSSASFSRWLAASPGAGGSPLRLVGWGGMAASAWLEAGLARVLFYPTLLYTVFRGRVRGPAHRDWYHRIDHTVLLGALPLRSMTRRVREAAGPGRAGSGPRASASAPRPSLSPLFASAAGTGRERARGDHHERRVRDSIPVELFQGAQLEPRGGYRSHRQNPLTHLHQAEPAASSPRVPQGDRCKGSQEKLTASLTDTPRM
ncbi:phosphatidylglycerophosphatase and protein-tyrosine phosphatase 1 isoform X2 [Peromyscus maniculatus bairdii]|uniref:phosphatidylglycerophosphatase and protein-tyrosine phosphatase 1 isoform X2 n=1 Tax=Peromyscus maniculatus bairdii TaxID=230844 RepID=UPI001C2E76F3|nr:phosphatidylglycerophosphatase and protein-tyrosine phosphatase 1 isoform X2 [Peromyscus maniculatus bairdii]